MDSDQPIRLSIFEPAKLRAREMPLHQCEDKNVECLSDVRGVLNQEEGLDATIRASAQELVNMAERQAIQQEQQSQYTRHEFVVPRQNEWS
jgi:hypothetical protein